MPGIPRAQLGTPWPGALALLVLPRLSSGSPPWDFGIQTVAGACWEHPTVEQHSKHSKKPTKPRVLLFHGLPPSLPSLGLGGWQAWQGDGHPQPLSTGTGPGVPSTVAEGPSTAGPAQFSSPGLSPALPRSCLTLKPRSFEKQGKPKLRGQRVKEPSPIPAHPKAPQSSCCQVSGALGRILCPGLEPPPAQLLGGQNSRLSTWDRAKAEHSTHSSENITTFPVFHTKSWMQSSSIPTQLALQVQSPPRTGIKSCPALLGMQTS